MEERSKGKDALRFHIPSPKTRGNKVSSFRSRGAKRGFAYDGRRLFSPCGKKRRGKKRGLFFPRKQKVETKFPMNDVSLGHRRLILRPTPAAAGRAGRPGPLITVPQRLHVEKLLPGMGAQAFVEEQAPPFRSEDKRRIEKRCSRRGHSSCRGLRPKRRVVGGK